MNPEINASDNGSSPASGSHQNEAPSRHHSAEPNSFGGTQQQPAGPGNAYTSFSQTESLEPASGRSRAFAFLGESRAYLVEYALALISTGILLSVVISMLNTILKYNKDDLGYFSSFAYTVSISLIATLIVAIPLVLVLTRRTNSVEEASPQIKDRGWRKGFLGFFLLNVGLWGIGFMVALVYDFISYLASIGITDDYSFPWRAILANGIAAIILLFTLWLYSHDYRNQQTAKVLVGKVHHYGLISLAIVLTLIYLATAFKSQRGSFIDDAISGDLNSIQSKVAEYQSAHRRSLPASLSDLDLNEQQKGRADKYGYTYDKTSKGYELCAVFKTDTKSKKNSGSQNPLEAFSSSSYGYSSSSGDSSNPNIHGKGKQCFTTRSSSYIDDSYLRSGSQNSSSSDLQLSEDDTLSN